LELIEVGLSPEKKKEGKKISNFKFQNSLDEE